MHYRTALREAVASHLDTEISSIDVQKSDREAVDDDTDYPYISVTVLGDERNDENEAFGFIHVDAALVVECGVKTNDDLEAELDELCAKVQDALGSMSWPAYVVAVQYQATIVDIDPETEQDVGIADIAHAVTCRIDPDSPRVT